MIVLRAWPSPLIVIAVVVILAAWALLMGAIAAKGGTDDRWTDEP